VSKTGLKEKERLEIVGLANSVAISTGIITFFDEGATNGATTTGKYLADGWTFMAVSFFKS